MLLLLLTLLRLVDVWMGWMDGWIETAKQLAGAEELKGSFGPSTPTVRIDGRLVASTNDTTTNLDVPR